MQISLITNPDNSGTIEIELLKEDYSDLYKKELKKYSGKVQMKGFRKGKAPSNMIHKLHGPSILLEVINDMISAELTNFIKEKELDLLGNPMPSEEQQMYDFNPATMDQLVFRYDVAWYPTFEMKGISSEDSYKIYDVIISDEDVEKEFNDLRNKAAQPVPTDEPVDAEDMIEIEAVEDKKELPFTCTFKVRMADIADEDLRNSLVGKQKDHSFKFDIFELEGMKPEMVRKYIFKLDDSDETQPGNWFTGKIVSILKNKPAEMDEEFFKRYFGEEVTSEEEARTEMKKYLKSINMGLVYGHLFEEIRNGILESNPMQISDSFILRMLKELEEKSGEPADGDLEKHKEALIWLRLRDHIAEQEDIAVDEKDIDEHFQRQVYNYFGGAQYVYSMMDDMVNRMKSNKKMVNEASHKIMDDKVFFAIKDKVTLINEEISLDELKALSEVKKEEVAAS
jgi:trigger factor